jgi:flagella basal body P-ring formation protein FlgA
MKTNRQRAKGKGQRDSFTLCSMRYALCAMLFASFFSFAPSVALADRQHLMDTIKKAVLAELVNSVSENAELSGIKFLKGFNALDDAATYIVSSIVKDGYNGRNKIVYRATLCDDEKIVRTVLVEASYEVLSDVLVAAKPLSSGTVITGDDVYAVKQKNSRLPSGAVTDLAEIEGKKLKTNISQGVILRSDQFKNASGIKKGREVDVLVEGPNVLISTKGVLSNDASVGEAARVTCGALKKEINGILVSPDTVKVKI